MRSTLQLNAYARATAKRLLGPRLVNAVRRHQEPLLPAARLYRSVVSGTRALEIGGPSALFRDDGSLPLYGVLDELDNCVYARRTLWNDTSEGGEAFTFHPSKRPGKHIFSEAAHLQTILTGSYQTVLASHCLEHLANPLRGLAEWKRVLAVGGALVLVLPHREGTFDWRRPTTTLAHMVSDHDRGVGEDDMTHLQEILDLHDLARDKPAGSFERFRTRCLQNAIHRGMHHHVFDTFTAAALVDVAGFEILRVDGILPYHVFVLARRTDRRPDNTRHLGPLAGYRHNSPFSSDRAHG